MRVATSEHIGQLFHCSTPTYDIRNTSPAPPLQNTLLSSMQYESVKKDLQSPCKGLEEAQEGRNDLCQQEAVNEVCASLYNNVEAELFPFALLMLQVEQHTFVRRSSKHIAIDYLVDFYQMS